MSSHCALAQTGRKSGSEPTSLEPPRCNSWVCFLVQINFRFPRTTTTTTAEPQSKPKTSNNLDLPKNNVSPTGRAQKEEQRPWQSTRLQQRRQRHRRRRSCPSLSSSRESQPRPSPLAPRPASLASRLPPACLDNLQPFAWPLPLRVLCARNKRHISRRLG